MNEFREHFPRILRGFCPLFCVLQTVHENKCLIEQGAGDNFRRKIFLSLYGVLGWARLPPNVLLFRLTVMRFVIGIVQQKQKKAADLLKESRGLGFAFSEVICRLFLFFWVIWLKYLS